MPHSMISKAEVIHGNVHVIVTEANYISVPNRANYSADKEPVFPGRHTNEVILLNSSFEGT